MQSPQAEEQSTPASATGEGVANDANGSQEEAKGRGAWAVAWSLAKAMAGDSPSISTGDQAALRRLKPGEPGGPAFWKIAVHYLEEELPHEKSPSRDAAERRWAAALSAIARLKDHHKARFRLGRALAAADVSEARVLRLLRAHDDTLLDTFRAVVHQLASRGQPVDVGELTALVTSDGSPAEEAVRRNVALSYYRSAHSEDS